MASDPCVPKFSDVLPEPSSNLNQPRRSDSRIGPWFTKEYVKVDWLLIPVAVNCPIIDPILEFSGNVITVVEFKSVGGELGAVFSIV